MTSRTHGARYIWILAALFALMGWAAAAAAQDDATPEAEPPLSRVVLSEAEPVAAPGYLLELSRIVIQPGVVLPVHTHPGVQMALVDSGVLTYNVLSDGIATVTRADGAVETLEPGDTTELRPGDSVVEPEGMVHFGENLGDVPVVLIVGSLFELGEPPSEPVSEATPGATPAS